MQTSCCHPPRISLQIKEGSCYVSHDAASEDGWLADTGQPPAVHSVVDPRTGKRVGGWGGCVWENQGGKGRYRAGQFEWERAERRGQEAC